MNLLNRRLVYGAVATALVVAASMLAPTPAASGECECETGYNYAHDGQPCTAPGQNCSVCTCPPSTGPKQQS